jgi:AcrR family transcriptional regulator
MFFRNLSCWIRSGKGMQARGEETRSRILHSALSLFGRQGYDATGVAGICEAAAVSKGAFYHHFE